MNVTAIKTRIIEPPQDDVFSAIRESDLSLKERDVLVVSSKVIAIHEGRAVPIDGTDKEQLVRDEADVYVEQADSRWRICLKFGTFLAGAGIDESNGREHYVFLPKDPHKSAKKFRTFLQDEFSVKEIGVIVADSHTMPLRYGTTGVALGWAGIEPVRYFTGDPDLFGRLAKFTRINVVDALAVCGVFAMGELSEQTPLALIRDIPHIVFSDRDTSQELLIPPREDIYWPLLRTLFEK